VSAPLVVESDVDVRVTKLIRTHYVAGHPIRNLAVLSDRLVTEVAALWVHNQKGEWRVATLRVTSSLPRRDGTPSALSKTHVLSVLERRRFLAQFTDVATPPGERVTITIEREQ
jgi:hypothetical protein